MSGFVLVSVDAKLLSLKIFENKNSHKVKTSCLEASYFVLLLCS